MKNKIVIGTWPMSGDWGPVDPKNAINILEKSYYKYGFKEFDTAPNYGNGFSEFLLGKIFNGENDILFNTKVGSKPFGGKAFDIENIKYSIDESLSRLNCNNINVLFLHNPRHEVTNYDKILNLLNEYKSQRIINKIGLSCAKGFDYMEYVDFSRFDYLQDDINLLSLSPLINNNNIKYYARSPLAGGILSGRINAKTVFSDSDHRSEWLVGERLISICKRVDKLKSVSSTTITDLALRFIHHNEKIYKTIYGIKSIDHLDNLFALIKTSPLQKSEINTIYKLFQDDYCISGEKHLGY